MCIVFFKESLGNGLTILYPVLRPITLYFGTIQNMVTLMVVEFHLAPVLKSMILNDTAP